MLARRPEGLAGGRAADGPGQQHAQPAARAGADRRRGGRGGDRGARRGRRPARPAPAGPGHPHRADRRRRARPGRLRPGRRVPEADPHTEVGQLAGAVNTMLDAVEREYGARYESEQRMRRFLADASHELRTPLTSLRGYAELVRLRGGLDEGPPTRCAGSSPRAPAWAAIEDLLILARADRGARRAGAGGPRRGGHRHGGRPARGLPDRPVSVQPPARCRCSGPRTSCSRWSATCSPTRPCMPTGRSTSGAGGRTARWWSGSPTAGRGCRRSRPRQVFDRFWRADAARTRVRGGSGLGLSIVQALVTEHGGRVAFESDPAAGSTVTVRLPAAP